MSNIRNFCIIAHIDHGKSTLADRFLELTNTVPKRKMRPQLLDQMELERERGITIKLQPVRMEFNGYILNLIDTPGHMDFYLEVKRSLQAVEGAILLIDATKGIQAQTLSNLELAQELGLKIIPVINKIDLKNINIPEIEKEIKKIINTNKIFKISAKTGKGVKELLEAVIKEIPKPREIKENIIFDSFYDEHQGIINYIRVAKKIVGRVGVFKPEMVSKKELSPGEIGYFITKQKEIKNKNQYQSLIFASLFGQDLKSALQKLQLNDQALSIEQIYWPSLGQGFKCGFLGLLHMEIVLERLNREFNIQPIITAPQVEIRNNKEPWIELEIITQTGYLNKIMNLLKVECQEIKNLGPERLILIYHVPLYDIIKDFIDKLKSVSSGFASMGYKFLDWRESRLKKLDILINKEKIEAFSRYISKESEARKIIKKIKEVLPKQQFSVPIQGVVNNKIIARETVKAYRKDVIAGLYGGDYTRKKKHLERQKKGKKKMAKLGKINISNDVFIKALRY